MPVEGSPMRKHAVLAAALVIAVVPFAGARAQPLCGGPPPMAPLSFAPPVIVDPVRAGGEPVVTSLPDGTLVYSTHAGDTHLYKPNMPDADFVTPYTGADYVWRSTDRGATWEYVGLAGLGVGPHALVTGFSDPTLAVDAAGNVYVAGIRIPGTVYTAKSSDSGRTWEGNPAAAFNADREWLAADLPDMVYLNGNATPGGRQLWRSTDGGRTWPIQGVPLQGTGPTSPIVVDPTDGRLYFSDAGNFGGFGTVQVFPNARSGDLTTTWRGFIRGGLPHAYGFLNPIALDDAGNVYVVANTSSEVRLAYSTDRGESFTSVVVDRPGKEVLWPWVAAGADGRVAVAWLEADRDLGDVNVDVADYRIVVAQTVTGHGWTDACGEERAPEFVRAFASDPIHRGTICTFGLGCNVFVSGDRRLGDFFTMEVARDGALMIAYGETVTKPSGAISRPAFVLQSGGLDFR